MVEVDLNDGTFREVDLGKPVHCAKCGQEIVRDRNRAVFEIPVHTCGYAFCWKCKKALNDFARPKLEEYENNLVKEFVNDRG